MRVDQAVEPLGLVEPGVDPDLARGDQRGEVGVDGEVGELLVVPGQAPDREGVHREDPIAPEGRHERLAQPGALLDLAHDRPPSAVEPLAEDDHVVAVGVVVGQHGGRLVPVLEVEPPGRLVVRERRRLDQEQPAPAARTSSSTCRISAPPSPPACARLSTAIQ